MHAFDSQETRSVILRRKTAWERVQPAQLPDQRACENPAWAGSIARKRFATAQIFGAYGINQPAAAAQCAIIMVIAAAAGLKLECT